MDAPLKIYYAFSALASIQTIAIELNDEEVLRINVPTTRFNQNDEYICINTKTHLIEGLDENYNKTGTLYNGQIESGDFFNLPTGQNILYSSQPWNMVKFNYIYY